MVSVKPSDKSRASARSKINLGGRAVVALAITLFTLLILSQCVIWYALSQRRKETDGIFVISLQGSTGADRRNEGRLDAFKEKWRHNCGSAPRIHHCPGALDGRRGYGLTKSWLHCLERAKEMDLEVNVIFEDDARIFERAESLSFCDPGKRKNLIWSGLPEDAFLAFLGGHSWKYADVKEGDNAANSDAENPIRFRPTSFSYGTYGFAVPRQSLGLLLETIRGDIAHGWRDSDGILHTEFLSPEKSWYRVARDNGKRIYAADPLMVWHEGGFSNTWKKDRGSITGEEVGDAVGGIRGVAMGG